MCRPCARVLVALCLTFSASASVFAQADPIKDKVKRWKVRKALIRLEPDVNRKAHAVLETYRKVFGDPEAEQEALKELDVLGKDMVPAVLNFMTKDLDHKTEKGSMMGSQLWNFLTRKARMYWKFETEHAYGMFESLEEKWNAIVDLKILCLEKGWKLESARKKPLEDLRAEAHAHFGAGRFEEAWKAFREAIEQEPSDSDLLNGYAWNLVTFAGKSPATARRALPFAQRAVELAPKNAAILDTLAEVYFVLGDTRKAIEWNAECRKVSRMTSFFEQLAKYARRYIVELDEADGPKTEKARARAWVAEGLLGKRPPGAVKAESYARDALALDPANPDATRLLARSLFHRKMYPKAAEAFASALARPGADEDARLHFGLGYALLETKGANVEVAVLHLRKALDLDPTIRYGRRTLARAYLESGDPEAALAEAQIAEAQIKDRWQPERDREPLLVLIGKAWERKGKPAWALEFFLQALLSRGNDPEAETGLDRTYRASFLEGPPPREYFAGRNRISTPFFDDVTRDAGLADASGRRVAFVDADGDGRPDLLLNGCRLWLNRGGTFENATEKAGLSSAGGNGGLFADVDNDGDLDIFMTSHGKTKEKGDALFLNDGKGGFALLSSAGVADVHPTEGAGFGDYDGDGNIDLYVANYEGPMSVGHPDFLYKGLGNGNFKDVTDSAGIKKDTLRCGRGVNWGDFDNDGDLDIHVSNYRLNPNFLFENKGNGVFTEVAGEKGVKGVPIRGYFGHTIGADFGDIDNDGDLDLFQANLAHPRFIEFSDQSFLMINSGAPHFAFSDNRRKSGIRFEETHSDPVLADFDNDGFLDLYVTSVYKDRKSFLYRNNGDGTFTDVTWYAGVRADNGWGCAVADVDGDGDLDLLVCAGGGPRLFRNRGNGNAWLAVRVIGGPKSNRGGLGARVLVRYGEGLLQMREIKGGRGTTSQDEPRAHFGFGDFRGEVEVTVRFLANPSFTRTYPFVKLNQVFKARENE